MIGFVTYAVIPSLLGGLICGMALGNVALVIVDPSFDQIMGTDFHLEAFSSMMCWGGLTGACVGSVWLNNIAGRRFAIATSALIALFGSIGSVAAPTPFGLLTSRFFQGVSLGILSHSLPIYVAEISPSSMRGIGVGVFEFSVSLGVLAVYILSFWLLSTKNENDLLNPEEKWQLLLFVPGVPAFFLLAQYVLGYLPASPRWLLLRNRHAEARNVLLLVAASSSSSSNSTQVENELNIIKHAILLERRLENHSKSVSNRLKSIVCAAGLMLFQVLVGIDLFTVYFFYICRRAAMPLSDSGNLLVLTGVVHIIVGILVLPLIDRVGRRTLLRVGSWVMCVSMIGLSMMITSKPSISHPFMFSVFILLFCAAFSSTWGPIAVLVSTESLPLSTRSIGMSIAVGVNFLGGAGVTGTFISLANCLGLRGAVLVYAAICALSDVFVLYKVPAEFDMPELNLEYSSEIISSPHSHQIVRKKKVGVFDG